MRRVPGGAFAPPIAEVNMTPLIDVSLVLVVILLVATPFAFEAALRVQAAGAAGHVAPTAAADRVELALHADGTVDVNGTRVTSQVLDQVLARDIAAGSSRTVVLRCEDAVSHGAFVQLVDRARRAGAVIIAVEGR